MNKLRSKGISYCLLNIYLLPRFVSVYRKALKEVEGSVMTEKHLGNWSLDTIEKMNTLKYPDHFYLCAMRSKKIVGIVIVGQAYNIEGIKSAMFDTFFILPEYRKFTNIAQTLAEMAVAWVKQRQFKVLYGMENIDTNKWEKKTRIFKFKPIKKLLKMSIE